MVTVCRSSKSEKLKKHGCRVRLVPAFTIQSLQRNTKVIPPPSSNFFHFTPVHCTSFKRFYDRRDLPVAIQPQNGGYRLIWKVPEISKLDYYHYLPIFFDGLRETQHPYNFLAINGSRDLIKNAPDKAFTVIPQLIIPLKKALCTKHPAIIRNVMTTIQFLVKQSPIIGLALVPYYRQMLPTFNYFVNKKVNIGANIDYSKDNRYNIGDLVDKTLEVLEQNGGEDAYINIKYLIPTYESCLSYS